MFDLGDNILRQAAVAFLLLAVVLGGAATAEESAEGVFEMRGVEAALLRPFEILRRDIKENEEVKGYVDWSNRRIVTVGCSLQAGRRPVDALMARRAAEVIALRNALALSAGIRIGVSGRVDGLRNGTVALQGLLKDYEVARTYEQTLAGRLYCVAEVRVPMFGVRSVAAAVYDAQLSAHRGRVSGMRRAAWAECPPDAPAGGDILVIDARGLSLPPSMYPLVACEDGQVFLDMETAAKGVAVGRGVCAWATTRVKYEELRSLRRADVLPTALVFGPSGREENFDGVPAERFLLAQAVAEADAATPASQPETSPASQPETAPASQPRRQPRRIPVKATRVDGKDKAVLVVGSEDALKALKDDGAADAARGGRVLIVVDAASAGMEGRLPDRTPGRDVFARLP